MELDLTSVQIQLVKSLLNAYLPEVRTWAYGSRVKGKATPSSDLDLVVFTSPEQTEQVMELRDAFAESVLPFRVDVFVWDQMPEQFKENILQQHVVLT